MGLQKYFDEFNKKIKMDYNELSDVYCKIKMYKVASRKSINITKNPLQA